MRFLTAGPAMCCHVPLRFARLPSSKASKPKATRLARLACSSTSWPPCSWWGKQVICSCRAQHWRASSTWAVWRWPTTPVFWSARCDEQPTLAGIPPGLARVINLVNLLTQTARKYPHVPGFIQGDAAEHPAAAQYDHSSLKHVIYAGAPMYKADQQRALGWPVLPKSAYGTLVKKDIRAAYLQAAAQSNA